MNELAVLAVAKTAGMEVDDFQWIPLISSKMAYEMAAVGPLVRLHEILSILTPKYKIHYIVELLTTKNIKNYLVHKNTS